MVQGNIGGRMLAPIAAGTRVVGIDGMTLEVESNPDKTLVPRAISAIAGTDWEES